MGNPPQAASGNILTGLYLPPPSKTGSSGRPSVEAPPWGRGTGLLGGGGGGESQEKELPRTGDIEDDVMRV